MLCMPIGLINMPLCSDPEGDQKNSCYSFDCLAVEISGAIFLLDCKCHKARVWGPSRYISSSVLNKADITFTEAN